MLKSGTNRKQPQGRRRKKKKEEEKLKKYSRSSKRGRREGTGDN